MNKKFVEDPYTTIEFRDNCLFLIDQRKLPAELVSFSCRSVNDIEFAIRDMVVRGAPAIGATAAYGVYLAARESIDSGALNWDMFTRKCNFLEAARPTAVNLHWAVSRMTVLAESLVKSCDSDTLLKTLHEEADTILREDIETNHRMAEIGNAIIPEKAVILTHCNTGALATGGWGTALGVIKEAHYSGKDIFVYADETRPRLQGARLTAWELVQAGIPSRLIPDSAAAVLIRDGLVDLVILGADRIASNGDVCNKIGTFMLSVLCKEYGVPFYAAAPISTIDFSIADGSEIPIEERDPEEVTCPGGVRIAPESIKVFNPAFDVTPQENITGIITEAGILKPPFTESIAGLREPLA